MAVSDQLTDSRVRVPSARARQPLLRSVSAADVPVRLHLSDAVRDSPAVVLVLEAVVGDRAVDVSLHQAQAQVMKLEEGPGSSRLPVIAVTERADIDSHRAAMAMGAAALLDLRCSVTDVETALAAAFAGSCVVPRSVGPRIAGRLEEPPPGLELTAEELLMLQGVADGRTVEELAAMFDCSSRHLRRHLRHLWSTLGATGRATGLVKAARWGLVR